MTPLVPSPCVDVCKMDETSGWCQGCMRTIGEIAAWSTLPDTGKRQVWKQLPQRRLEYLRLHPASSLPPQEQEP